MKEIKSTLARPNGKAILIDKFETSVIIEHYANFGINVKRFFNNSKILLYECVSTKYRFFHPEAIIGDAQFYENLSKTKASYYSERWEHTKALGYINKKDIVLEIGSGFGAFLKILKEKKIISKGLELNPHAVLKCQEDGLDVEKIVLNNISENEVYDIVCYFQVLEHIYNVNEFIHNSVSVLKKGGKLIIGVPNNNPYLFINDKYHTLNLPPHHAGLWNKKSLKSLEKFFPLKLINLEFEPLELTFDYFINQQIENIDNAYLKRGLGLINRKFPKFLKWITCRFFKGRNVLAIFEKI